MKLTREQQEVVDILNDGCEIIVKDYTYEPDYIVDPNKDMVTVINKHKAKIKHNISLKTIDQLEYSYVIEPYLITNNSRYYRLTDKYRKNDQTATTNQKAKVC